MTVDNEAALKQQLEAAEIRIRLLEEKLLDYEMSEPYERGCLYGQDSLILHITQMTTFDVPSELGRVLRESHPYQRKVMLLESTISQCNAFLQRALKAEDGAAKLAAFKAFVHRRLDEAGVPTHPDGKHTREGCRIGDRLDIVLKGTVTDTLTVTPKKV